MEKAITQQEVMAGLFAYYDDLEFIEKINDMTYARKVQLKAKLRKQE